MRIGIGGQALEASATIWMHNDVKGPPPACVDQCGMQLDPCSSKSFYLCLFPPYLYI